MALIERTKRERERERRRKKERLDAMQTIERDTVNNGDDEEQNGLQKQRKTKETKNESSRKRNAFKQREQQIS